MAEFIMRDMLRKRQIEGISVSSSSTSTEEIWKGVGNPVYPPARAELARHGLSCEGKRAIQLQKSDYDKYDLFICMDGKNMRNALGIFGSDREGKLRKLLSYTGEERDVSDPWYSNEFDVAYDDIYRGCEALLESLSKKIKTAAR